jgi:hypothetical protein
VRAGFYSWEKLNNLELLDWKHYRLSCFIQYTEIVCVSIQLPLFCYFANENLTRFSFFFLMFNPMMMMIVSMGWNYVSEQRPPTGLLFILQVIYEHGEPWMLSSGKSSWFVHQSALWQSCQHSM